MRKLIALTGVFLLSATAGANAITISAGGGAWRENPEGWIEYKSDSVQGTGVSSKTHVDVDDDLNLGTETKGEGWFKISDIPIPLFPDVKVQYTGMKFTGSGVVNSSFTFGKITVPTKSYVESKLRANQVDVTLTYSIPFLRKATSGRVSANWGVNVKVIDGYVRVKYRSTAGNGEDSKSATIPVPMVHLDGEIRPIDLVGLELSGNFVGYGGSKFYETEAELKVYPIKHTFLGVGYRYQRLKIDDISDVSSDLKVKGVFAEAGIRF
ncbi:outer membrane protein [Balnearium lithotrophicum]|uniref:Outer membrane protein n=1 Tax=Balnearium lithotrophicum TaxID=223788 RepID=A0A521ATX0_9BACT|nr:TIGR04219 family outer membrane beta-barrel protein [Balnearium lithotrophicum]SMO38181.1 outer membrane protein [Balnearium lithotrophicum]